MTLAFAIFIIVHGLIHLLGFVKAFGLAQLPQLHQPVSAPMGALWLLATLLFLTAAPCLFVWPRGWWIIGAIAIAVSLAAIIPSWSDARFGAIADGIAFVGVTFGFLAHGPVSLEAMYKRDVIERLTKTTPAELILKAELERLPTPVQRYLRASGVVGQPRIHNVRARMHGRFRSSASATWMAFRAEQYNFFDRPARFFYMTASRFAIPFYGYHRYLGSNAAMQVKLAALVPVANASGDEMTQGETVTMFNDMCVMAPHTLVDPSISWRSIDAHTVEGAFTNAGHTIRAILEFNEAGELVNFRSNDRYQSSPDGTTMRRLPWSTPLHGRRSFGGVWLASSGEARWREPDREYTYIELAIDDVQYNVTSP